MKEIEEIIKDISDVIAGYAKEMEKTTEDGTIIIHSNKEMQNDFMIGKKEVSVLWKYYKDTYRYGDQLVFDITNIYVDDKETEYNLFVKDRSITVDVDGEEYYFAYIFDPEAIRDSLTIYIG